MKNSRARRAAAVATALALAGGATAVPAGPLSVVAQAQTEYQLGATATKDSLGGGGWLGSVRLMNGDYAPKTISSVRLNFSSSAGNGLSFPPHDTYDVRLVQGTTVLQNLGTIEGYGESDSSGNRWLDLDLRSPVTLQDGLTLQIRKPGAANSLPIRAGLTAPGPTAIGYSDRRFEGISLSPTTGSVSGEQGGQAGL